MSERRGLSLEGDVAIITGGAQGIGEATARLFAERGAAVMVADLNADRAEDVAISIGFLGCPAAAFGLDITDTDQLDELVTTTTEIFGGINHLVNNAGVAIDARLAAQSDEDFERTLAVNLIAPRNLTRRVINSMLADQRTGTISFASSTTAEFGLFGQTAYGATKGGLETLTMALAREVGKKGIRVNAVAPGPIDTPMLGQVGQAGLDSMRASVALDRLGNPEEIAEAYAWLASDLASFVTGAVIKVDGGYKKG